MTRVGTKIPGKVFSGTGPLWEPKPLRDGAKWKLISCPKEDCLASPGNPCRRYVAGLVAGKDIGGGYWRFFKKPHAERKELANNKES